MNNPLTHRYLQYQEQERRRLLEELKRKLIQATFETDHEVLSQFNFFVNSLYDQLFWEVSDGQKRKSWFREKVVDKFQHDKYRYKEGFQVDGFVENILPEIRQEFRRRWEDADERTRSEKYFDQYLALDANPEEIIRLLALHDTYHYFFDHRQELLHEATEMLQKEKQLVDENHFNNLSPLQVLEYMEQLQQINPVNKEPFLSEKQTYDLTNMICQDQPVTDPIRMNLLPEQKKFMVRFIYEFYKFCKDEVDSKGTRNKYLSILSCYISQFEDQQGPVNEKNFAREQPDSPIKVDPKFGRWKNA